MAKSTKLFAVLITLIFSDSASAVIIEGSFEGRMWDYWGTNMELSPEAKFWNGE